MKDFDSITPGDKVQITASDARVFTITVTYKILDRASHVMGWATDDPMVTVTRKNFLCICEKDS